MEEIALARINSFASPAPTADFLQALLAELSALREEVARLQEDNQDLRERVVTLESRQITTQKRIASISDTQDDICDKIDEHAAALNTIWKATKKDEKPDTTKASLHIDELYNHMKLVGLKQTTFAGAAKILKVTKQRVLQLKPAIAQDMRFLILPSQSHSQKLVIRLRVYHEL